MVRDDRGLPQLIYLWLVFAFNRRKKIFEEMLQSGAGIWICCLRLRQILRGLRGSCLPVHARQPQREKRKRNPQTPHGVLIRIVARFWPRGREFEKGELKNLLTTGFCS